VVDEPAPETPRRRFITVYGRLPVLEALDDPRVDVDKVVLASGSRGERVDEIVDRARARGVDVRWASAQRVTRISRNGRHDQGVVADVRVAGLQELGTWLAARPAGAAGPLLVLDGLTNPANVGMIIRVATAAGTAGTVLPRIGCADLGPLVVKASAGVVFRATVLRADTAAAAASQLSGAGYRIYGLRAAADRSLFDGEVPARAAMVLGSETDGVSTATAALVDEWLSLPMEAGVESLNVATAAAVVAYELARRSRAADRR
jgi:23S rRNA (guanosine2251-2'-O)-methyltransferase